MIRRLLIQYRLSCRVGFTRGHSLARAVRLPGVQCIPTRRPLVLRLLSALGAAFDIPWVPLAVALLALFIINS